MFIRVSSLMSFSIITLFFLSPAIADQRSVEVPAKETGISTGNYFALIIGNNKYKYLPKLKTAVADATDVGKVLKDLYGFKTKLLLDATRSEILDGINEMREQLGPDDSLLIYYAGHGEYKEEADKAYWLPVDAQPAKTTNWIIADDITSNIKFITAKHILLVSDSCYSGALSRAATTELKDKNDREAYMKKMLARTSRTLMASGGNEPVSDSGGGNHSVFAAAFIKALSEADKLKFTAEELFQGWVKGSVAGKSDQVPGYGSIRNSGDEGGDFVFIAKKNRLDNLSVDSAIRQKELEQLKRMEAEAEVAEQKEQAEIARKESELAELDKQIAQMKERLGAGAVKTGDSLDAMLAMVQQKEEQAKRLEELRRQRENEERKRQEEIARLKREDDAKRIEQLKEDFAKYQKIAHSQYGQEIKGAAWAALVAPHPEAKGVPQGDDGSFLAVFGLASDAGSIITLEDKKWKEAEWDRIEKERIEKERPEKERQEILAKGGRFRVDGGVIEDLKLGLEWAPKSTHMNHYDAVEYVRNLRLAGGGWRLPTIAELRSLKGNLIPAFNVSDGFFSFDWGWSSELNGSSNAWFYYFGNGNVSSKPRGDSLPKVLAVRSRRW